MKELLNTRWREILAALVALLLVLTLGASDLMGAGSKMGAGRITDANETYLADASSEALRDTLMLGEVAALLEVLKSTDLGVQLIVSVDVQAGGVLSSLTTAVDWALGAAAAAAVSAEALTFLNSVADQVSAVLLLAALVVFALWMILRLAPVAAVFRSMGRALTEGMVVLFLMTYLVLPYSINVGGWLGETVAGSIAPDTDVAVEQFHGATFKSSGLNTDLNFWSNSGNVRSVYEDLTDELPDKVSSLTSYAVQSLAHLIVVGLMFPLLVVIGLGLICRRLAQLSLKEFEQLLDLKAQAGSVPT